MMPDERKIPLSISDETQELPRPEAGAADATLLSGSASTPTDPSKVAGIDELPHDAADGRYLLQGEIARGGMGAIIRCRDQDLERDLAIKVLLTTHQEKPETVQRFVEEAQISGQLQHPGIVPVHELGTLSDGRPFFAMKLVKGETLKELLTSRENLHQDRSRFVAIFQQICQTMGYAHSRSVVHRDLKPANIMVGAFGEVQVMDWGLAKVLNDDGRSDTTQVRDEQTDVSVIRTVRTISDSSVPGSSISASATNMGSVLGTIAYMPPEQALGEVDRLDERADVFGLGGILAFILSGEPPYIGENAGSVLRLAMRGKVEDAFERLDTSGAESELIDLAKRCLAPEIEDRPGNAKVVADEVAAYLESVADRLHKAELEQIEIRTRTVEERKRRRVMMALAATIFVMFSLAGGGWIWLQKQETKMAREETRAAEKEAQRQVELARIETAAKQQALAARKREADLRVQTQEAKHKVEITLTDVYTSRGLLAVKDGDPATATMWFAKSALQSTADPEREAHGRLRARNWSREAILPVAALRPPAPAETILFQPAGHYLLVQAGWYYLMWDWKTDEVLPWLDGHNGVQVACWDPSGLSVAIATPNGTVEIRSVPDGNVLHEFDHPDPITVLAYSPDGKSLAIGGTVVRIWSTENASFIDVAGEHETPIHAIVFNRQGTRLVTASSDKLARVFAVDDLSLPAPLFAPVVHAPNRPPSGPALVDGDRGFVTIKGDRELTWWSMEDGSAIRDIPTSPTWGLSHVVSSLQGDLLVTGGYYGPDIWRVADIDVAPVHLNHVNFVDHMVISSDGSLMMTASWDSTAQLWSLPDGRPLGPRLTHNIGTHRVAISDDNAFLVTSQDNRLVRIWKRPVESVIVSDDAWGDSPRLSFDGRLVTPGIWHESPGGRLSYNRTISVRAVSTGKPIGPVIVPPGQFIDSSLCSDNETVVAVSQNDASQNAASGADASGWFAAWNVKSGRELFPRRALSTPPVGVSTSPTVPHAAVLCNDGQLHIFDTVSGELLFTKHQSWDTTNLALPENAFTEYTPDGTKLVVKAADDFLYVYDAASLEPSFAPIQILLNGKSPCRAAALSADSQLVATGSNGVARVWSLRDGSELCEPLLHPEENSGMTCVGFSQAGERLITANSDRLARVWDWKSGTLVCPPLRHSGAVFSAALSPDGRYAVSSSRGKEGGPHFWELTTGKPIAPSREVPQIEGDVNGARGVLFSPDGSRVIASVGALETLAIFDMARLLAPPTATTEELRMLGEVATSQSLELGEPNALTMEEWEERWDLLRVGEVFAESETPHGRVKRHLSAARRLQSQEKHLAALTELRGAWDALEGVDWDSLEQSALLNAEERQLIRADILLEQAEAKWATDDNEAADNDVIESWRILEELVQAEPASPAALGKLAYALTYYSIGDADDESPMAYLPGSIVSLRLEPQAAVGAGWLVNGDYQKSIKILSETVKVVEPPPVEQLLLLSIAHHRAKDSDTAKRLYDQAIEMLKATGDTAELQSLTMITMFEVAGKTLEESAAIIGGWEFQRSVASLTKAIESDPNASAAHAERGELYAAFGEWDEATQDLTEAIRLNPGDHFSAYHLSSLLASAEDPARYRAHCQLMLDRSSATTSLTIADRTAIACMLLPNAVEDATAIDKMIEIVRAAPADHELKSWFLRAQALHAIREGQFAVAAKACEEGRRLSEQTGNSVLTAALYSIESMAHFQLDNAEAARASLAAATTLFAEEIPDAESGGIGAWWHDRLISTILYDEAEQLIGQD